MYSVEQIVAGIKSPDKIGYKINKAIHTRGGRQNRNPRGINFLDQDWDNLIILDACRHDLFSEYSDLPGELDHQYSLGSATKQFVRETFKNRNEHDLVYIGANTWFLKLKNKINSEIYKFVDLQNGELNVEWVNKKLNVVTPETVTHHAERIHDEYPQKRLIVHYLQPHHPFTGPTGKKYFSHSASSLSEVVRNSNSDISKEIVKKAYIETLERVIDSVEQLLPKLSGKTIITADHGEMLGERFNYVPIRGYGHPAGIYNQYTTKVPWNVVETGTRKEIVENDPIQDSVDIGTVDEQLRDLGYVV